MVRDMTVLPEPSGLPASLTRLEALLDYQPALDACLELKGIATDAELRRLAITTHKRLLELLLDRLTLQDFIDDNPFCYSQIYDSAKFQRVLKEKQQLEQIIMPKAQQIRRQVMAQRAYAARRGWTFPYFATTVAPELKPQPTDGGEDASDTFIDWLKVRTQGNCTLATTRRVYCWLAKLDPSSDSERPPTPGHEEISWDLFY